MKYLIYMIEKHNTVYVESLEIWYKRDYATDIIMQEADHKIKMNSFGIACQVAEGIALDRGYKVDINMKEIIK